VGEGRDDGDLCIDEDVHDAEVKLVVGVVGFTESGLRLYSVFVPTHVGVLWNNIPSTSS
jgi:hypothetical protein